MEIMLSTDPIIEKYLRLSLDNQETPFQYNNTRFLNLVELYRFIEMNHKSDFILFEEVLNDIITTAAASKNFYELGLHETKSGQTETINFEVNFAYNDEEDAFSNYTIMF